MDEVSRFYVAQSRRMGTHVALRWKGRVRYTVPREFAESEACWRLFQTRAIRIPFRTMARLPGLFGAMSCSEGAHITLIRAAMGSDAGVSCCRAGAPGPWLKDTLLFLDVRQAQPLYIVKAGFGEAVDTLLANEAYWLRSLGDQPTLACHIPELVAHHSGAGLSFVGQRALSGVFEFAMRELHWIFLRNLQQSSLQPVRYLDSKLYLTFKSRVRDLSGMLTEQWARRLNTAMDRVDRSLSGQIILSVVAHNDFTPWNIRIERHVAKVFDWEYADAQQMPLFDPLHFVLMPMALAGKSTAKMLAKMQQTIQACRQSFGRECCYEMQTQALAYLINICTLYLCSVQGSYQSHPVLDSYALLIDKMAAE